MDWAAGSGVGGGDQPAPPEDEKDIDDDGDDDDDDDDDDDYDLDGVKTFGSDYDVYPPAKVRIVIKTRPSILCVTQKRAFMPVYIKNIARIANAVQVTI